MKVLPMSRLCNSSRKEKVPEIIKELTEMLCKRETRCLGRLEEWVPVAERIGLKGSVGFVYLK